MPRIPTYQIQAQPSESTKPLIQDPGSVGLAEGAWAKAAGVVSDRAIKFQEEQDILAATDALSKFADDERQFLTDEQTNKRGMDAVGGQQRGGEFYEEAIKKHSTALSGNAAKLFSKKALQYREYGLDKLANHEATQHQEAKKAVFDKLKAETEQSIKSGASPDQLDARISVIKENIRSLHKGVDTTAIEAQTEEKLVTQFLVEQAGQNPSAIDSLLIRYGSVVGEDTKQQIMAFADKVEVDRAVETYMPVLKAENANDYGKMMKKVASLPIGEKAKKALETRVKDEYHTNKIISDMQKKEHTDSVLNKAVDLWSKNDFAGVRSLILNDKTLEPHQREHWIDKLDAQQKAIDSGKESVYAKTDQETRGIVMQTILERPDAVQVHQIWDFHGKGLSTDTCKELSATLSSMKSHEGKKFAEDVKRASSVIEDWRKAKFFGDPKAEGQLVKNKLMDSLMIWMRDNPDKDVIEDFLIPYRDDLKSKNFDKAMERFYRNTPAPVVRQKIMQPAAGKKEKTDSQFRIDWLGHDPLLEVK